MDDIILSIFNDNKPILKQEIETHVSKQNIVLDSPNKINDTLDHLLKQNIIENYTFQENNKNVTLYWKKRKIEVKRNNSANINKIKLNKPNSLHKNTAFKPPLLKKVNKTSLGISKSFRSPLLHKIIKDKSGNNEQQNSIKNKLSPLKVSLNSQKFNRTNSPPLLKFKKDKNILNKIKERNMLLNQLKQKEENIRRINLVLKHRETNEIEKLKLLINKWRKASQTITEVLKDKIGQVVIPNIFNNGTELKEVTLEQILNGLNINPSLLNYDNEEDCFK